MRMSQEEKVRSRDRIRVSAARLLRERGIDGASVADVMQDAGLTHGGFYKHFTSKDALVADAIDQAFAEFIALLEDQDDGAAYAAFRQLYLSDGHRANPGIGCPVAALGGELGRGSEGTRAAMGRGVRRIVDAIATTMRGGAHARRAAALREFSMLVGAVVIARASDPELGEQVLAAARGSVKA